MAENVVRGIDDKARLKAWLRTKGIHYVVFDAQRLTDACSMEQLENLQEIITTYEEHCRVKGHDATDHDWEIRASTPPGGLGSKPAA